MTTQRLTTTGRATAEAIRDRVEFSTSGSLKGCNVKGLTVWESGRLDGPDLDKFREECTSVDYVVVSYSTPIAWHTPNGWHRVAQKFSVTTSRQQGNLYLIEEEVTADTDDE